MTSGGTIEATSDGRVIWITDCIGGSLLSLKVWTETETLWEIEALPDTDMSLVPGTYGLAYGSVPAGFREVSAPHRIDGSGFVLVNWTFRDPEPRELPPGFGVQLPLDGSNEVDAPALASEVCGDALPADQYVLAPLVDAQSLP